jgi:hypothetical protein
MGMGMGMRIALLLFLLGMGLSTATASPCYQTDPYGNQYLCGGGYISIGNGAIFTVNETETLTISVNALGPVQGFFDPDIPGGTFERTILQTDDSGLTATYVGSFTLARQSLLHILRKLPVFKNMILTAGRVDFPPHMGPWTTNLGIRRLGEVFHCQQSAKGRPPLRF